MEDPGKERPNYRPVIGIALVSMLICGLLFPLAITGIAQVILPYQANGEIVKLDGHPVGSELIAQGFGSPMFFHARSANESASLVDPDINLSDALSQVPRVSLATGIPQTTLDSLVSSRVQGTFWIFGSPYVDVLDLNLLLIDTYPHIYANFTS
jgi:K+-transporting ATPase ATPase C chain